MFGLELEFEYVYNFFDNDDIDTGIYFTDEDVTKIGTPELFFATILQNGSLMRAYNKLIYRDATSNTLSRLARYLHPIDRNGKMTRSLEEILTNIHRPPHNPNAIYYRVPPQTNHPDFIVDRYKLVRSQRLKLTIDPAVVARNMYNGVTSGAGAGATGGKRHRKHTRKQKRT
jgi:hypothetical protein